MLYTTAISAKSNKCIDLAKPWKNNTALNVITSNEKLVFKGQGEGDTKWKGCAWNKLLVCIVIFFCL